MHCLQLVYNKKKPLNFWWLRCANYVKFTEECVMYIEKHVLVKKKKNFFTNWQNIS